MEEDIKLVENLIEEYKMFGDLDGIQDLKPYMESLEHLIKAYKELEEKWDKDTHKLQNALDMANADKINNYIPVSLVEEKRTKLKEQYNKVVNEINNQGMIDQLIDFKEVSVKLEMCEELLEKRK